MGLAPRQPAMRATSRQALAVGDSPTHYRNVLSAPIAAYSLAVLEEHMGDHRRPKRTIRHHWPQVSLRRRSGTAYVKFGPIVVKRDWFFAGVAVLTLVLTGVATYPI